MYSKNGYIDASSLEWCKCDPWCFQHPENDQTHFGSSDCMGRENVLLYMGSVYVPYPDQKLSKTCMDFLVLTSYLVVYVLYLVHSAKIIILYE